MLLSQKIKIKKVASFIKTKLKVLILMILVSVSDIIVAKKSLSMTFVILLIGSLSLTERDHPLKQLITLSSCFDGGNHLIGNRALNEEALRLGKVVHYRFHQFVSVN